jgi:hypothetical protein
VRVPIAPNTAAVEPGELESFDLLPRWRSPATAFWTVALALIALGLLARFTRYLPAWGPWGDETALVSNILDRDYAGLLRPLDSTQVAPVGYLWFAKTSSELFGINEHSLRLPSFICSIATLLLMVYIARAVTHGWAAVLAIGIVAVSHFQIRHGTEMKQYALECCVSAALLALALGTARLRPGAAWGLVALTPLALISSLGAVFVVGGISLALLPIVWERRSLPWWLWYVVYNAVLGLSFLALFFLILRPQMAVHFSTMDTCWNGQMPDWHAPLDLLAWLYRTATGSIFAQPVGGENSGSLPCALLFWIGVAAMWRRGNFLFLRLLAATFGLAIVAAMLRKYPLGGHPRLVLYLAPLVTMPIAVGMGSLVGWRAPDARTKLRRGVLALSVLVAIGLGGITRDLVKPYFSPCSRDLRSFARWFWTDYAASLPGPLVCVAQDNRVLPNAPREHDYLCARYQGKHSKPLDPVPERIDRLTGLVLCTPVHQVDYQELLPAWRAALQERFDVFEHETFHVNSSNDDLAVRYDIMWVRPCPVSQHGGEHAETRPSQGSTSPSSLGVFLSPRVWARRR